MLGENHNNKKINVCQLHKTLDRAGVGPASSNMVNILRFRKVAVHLGTSRSAENVCEYN